MGAWHPDWDWSGLTGIASASPFAAAGLSGSNPSIFSLDAWVDLGGGARVFARSHF
jgi:hypothetical protein